MVPSAGMPNCLSAMTQAVPTTPPMYAARAPSTAASYPLCPPGAELHHRAALRRTDNAVRLGGDQALMVEGDQKQRLDELGLDGRALHDDDGLVGENGRALGHSPDIAVEFKAAQIVEELLGEAAPCPAGIRCPLR